MDMIAEKLDALVLRGVAARLSARSAIAKMMDRRPPPRTEAERIDAIKARSLAPRSCGPDMPVAPARGRMNALPPMAMVKTASGYDHQHVGFRGRDAAKARDVFDEMADQARRAGGHDPFTHRQKDAGRHYAALVERHSSVGLKGRSIEIQRGGSGSGRMDVMDLILDEGRVIERMRASVGDGWALEVTRQTKRRRTPLTFAELVDRVCLRGESLSEVLRACGWAVYGETVERLREGLASALDRMASASSQGG